MVRAVGSSACEGYMPSTKYLQGQVSSQVESPKTWDMCAATQPEPGCTSSGDTLQAEPQPLCVDTHQVFGMSSSVSTSASRKDPSAQNRLQMTLWGQKTIQSQRELHCKGCRYRQVLSCQAMPSFECELTDVPVTGAVLPSRRQ